jgi:hypothetical protein
LLIVSRETFFGKKTFLVRQNYRIFTKNSEILFRLTPKRQLRAGKETGFPNIVCEGAFTWLTKKEKNQNISAGGFSRF